MREFKRTSWENWKRTENIVCKKIERLSKELRNFYERIENFEKELRRIKRNESWANNETLEMIENVKKIWGKAVRAWENWKLRIERKFMRKLGNFVRESRELCFRNERTEKA